jgi:hypothetical protein
LRFFTCMPFIGNWQASQTNHITEERNLTNRPKTTYGNSERTYMASSSVPVAVLLAWNQTDS